MKLSRLYSNLPAKFGPIDFVDGLNVVRAEIRLPENLDKDTHNLGKTTLGRVIDFCLLLGRDQHFFLFKRFELFKDFVFYLELELPDGSFATLRRSVEESSKISFKRHPARSQDFTNLSETDWDHFDVPFDRAREILDGVLDWRALKPWSYRKGLGYLLRGQEDYKEVFQLGKFLNKHADWKPFLAQLLGFNAILIEDRYGKEEGLEERQARVSAIEAELGGSVQDLSKIEGILLLKQKEAEKKQRSLDAFDFRTPDKERTKQLVDDIDEQISQLNSQRYSLTQNKKKVAASLESAQVLFSPDAAQNLFREAGVLFKGQIKKDFEQLISFNKAITEERHVYLEEEREELEQNLRNVGSELNLLGKRRSEALSFLSATDVFGKYKKLSDEMVILRADITSLERQRANLHRLQELRTEIRGLSEELVHLQSAIEADVEKQNTDRDSLFTSIRVYFSEIIEEVIDRKGLLVVSVNGAGHLEFRAEILDEQGKSTDAGSGHTYKKLLCIAFDLAVLRAYVEKHFPRFVYHDGVFESLDIRKKLNLLDVLRQYAALGLQPVVTLIDSDLPATPERPEPFKPEEIVVRLHDENESGRLFRIKSW